MFKRVLMLIIIIFLFILSLCFADKSNDCYEMDSLGYTNYLNQPKFKDVPNDGLFLAITVVDKCDNFKRGGVYIFKEPGFFNDEGRIRLEFRGDFTIDKFVEIFNRINGY